MLRYGIGLLRDLPQTALPLLWKQQFSAGARLVPRVPQSLYSRPPGKASTLLRFLACDCQPLSLYTCSHVEERTSSWFVARQVRQAKLAAGMEAPPVLRGHIRRHLHRGSLGGRAAQAAAGRQLAQAAGSESR